jgi:predicted nucleic acid-binding protein
MRDVSRLYLDTNVLIAIGEGAGQMPSLLRDLIQTLSVDEQFLFTSELSLAELLVVPNRQKNVELIRLYDNWIQPDGWLIARPVDKPVLWGAALIRAAYPAIKLPDAIHVSTALRHKCSHFLTADKRFPDEFNVTNDQRGRLISAKIDVVEMTVETLAKIVAERQL